VFIAKSSIRVANKGLTASPNHCDTTRDTEDDARHEGQYADCIEHPTPHEAEAEATAGREADHAEPTPCGGHRGGFSGGVRRHRSCSAEQSLPFGTTHFCVRRRNQIVRPKLNCEFNALSSPVGLIFWKKDGNEKVRRDEEAEARLVGGLRQSGANTPVEWLFLKTPNVKRQPV